jgi:hypothetical protein
MNDFLRTIGQHIIANAGTYWVAGLGILIAAGKCMPVNFPKSFQDLWTWARETIQTVIPVPRTTPTQPVTNPAQTK